MRNKSVTVLLALVSLAALYAKAKWGLTASATAATRRLVNPEGITSMSLHLSRVALAALCIGLLAGSPASAVTNGQPDGGGHPNVGALVVERPGSGKAPACSGTLVAPTVFLTAGHCTAGLDRVWVTFDSVLDPSSWTLLPGTARTDPLFGHDRSDLHDLGVVLLDRPVAEIAPAALAAAGAMESAVRSTSFTAVGYGYNDRATGGGQPRFLYDGVRRVASSPFVALTGAWLKLSQRGGGVCFGDSGGPRFDSAGTLVAVTSGGGSACEGLSWSYRLDTPSARRFLATFVSLP